MLLRSVIDRQAAGIQRKDEALTAIFRVDCPEMRGLCFLYAHQLAMIARLPGPVGRLRR